MAFSLIKAPALTAAASLATIVLFAVAAPVASAQTAVTVSPSFAPNRLGTKTAVTLKVSLSNPSGQPPAPLSKTVVMMPDGFTETLQWPTTDGCSRAHLEAYGARNCPAHSEIGGGSAVVQWQEGTKISTEQVNLQFFIGPTNGEYQLELLAEGHRPLHKRVVIAVPLFMITAPYSGGLEAIIPPIPTRPGQPDASLVSFSITVGQPHHPPRGSAAGKRWGDMGLFVPRSCPAGGFPWRVELTYADGTSQEALATVPCP